MRCLNSNKVISKFKELRTVLGENYKCAISDVIDILKYESFNMDVLELNKEYSSADYLVVTRWEGNSQYFRIRRR